LKGEEARDAFRDLAFVCPSQECLEPGLPDGTYIFLPKKLLWVHFEVDNICIFYVHLEYLTAIWYILTPFGIFCAHCSIFGYVLVYFTKKNLATVLGASAKEFEMVLLQPKTSQNRFEDPGPMVRSPIALNFSAFVGRIVA
jgi:hypothetical protein